MENHNPWDKNIPVNHIDDFVDECIVCKHNTDPNQQSISYVKRILEIPELTPIKYRGTSSS